MQGRPAKILNIASTAGITARPGWVAYAASKAAVVSLSADAVRGARRDGRQDLHDLARAGRRPSSAASSPRRRTPARSCSPTRSRDVIAMLVRRGRADAGRPEHHRPPADLTRADPRPMSRLEHALAALVLRVLGRLFDRCSRCAGGGSCSRRRALSHLEGNLAVPPRGDPPRCGRSCRVVHAAGAVQLRARRARSRYLAPARAWHVPACGRRGCSSSTTPTCRSTSRPTGRARRSSRSGTPSGR